MAQREPDDHPEEAGAAKLESEGQTPKEGNFVSIKVLGQAIESVGKGGLPDQIDLDALLKAVQRYKQEEGPKESSSGLNDVILPPFSPSASSLGQEALVKQKEIREPSQKIEQFQMGSVVDGLPMSATIGPGTIPMNSAIIPPLTPSGPLGPHPVLFGAQIRAWPGPEPIHNMHPHLQVPMSQFSAAGLNSGGIVGAPIPTVGVVAGQLPSEAPTQMPAPSLPIRNRMVSRRGPLSKSSPYRGVSCYKRTGRWESHIWHAGKQLHLGTHSTPEEAARVYDIAAIKLRGWGADLNFGAHTYRDDPQLKDLSLHCDKKTEEADVAKLVKGLKRRKGSGAKATKTKTAKIDAMPENPGAQPGGDFLPYAAEQGLHLSNLPRAPVAPMFFRHPSGQSLLMAHNPVVNSPTAARRISGDGLGGYLDGNGVVAPGARYMEPSPSMVVGSMPVGSNDQQQQQQQQQHAVSNGPPALFSNEPPMSWGQEHPSGAAGASHVTPSRVISLSRSPTFRQANVQPGIIKPTEPNNQLVWTSMIPNSQTVRVVLDNKAVTALGCQGEYILEGKPMPMGQGITPPGISTFWPGPGEAVPSQGQMTNRDQVVADQGTVCPLQSQDQRGVMIRSQDVASSSMIVPPGPVQSLQSVLQGVTAVGHETLGANPSSCALTSDVSPAFKPAASSPPPVRETPAQLGDSQQRFAKLLQLIHELPAKDIVRQKPVVEEGPELDTAPRDTDNKGQNCEEGDLEGRNDVDNIPFEGRQKLRPSLNARSAFKNWTSSDSGEAGKSLDDGQGVSGGRSRSTSHSGSDANQGNKSNSNGNGATCCSSGKDDQPPEQCDGKSNATDGADQEDNFDAGTTSGTKADHCAMNGNKRLMEDDLLAAQQLCQLSKMVGPGSSSGNSANSSGGKKRIRSGPPPTRVVAIPVWKTKRQRTNPSRQGRKDFMSMVVSSADLEKPGNSSEQVLSNSGKGNKQLCVVEGPTPECEDLAGVSDPIDTDVSVAGFPDDKNKSLVGGESPVNGSHGWRLEVEEGDNNSKTSTGGMECVNEIDDDEIPPLAQEPEGPPIGCGGNGVLDLDCHHQSGLWVRGYLENTTSGSGVISEGEEKVDCLEEEIATLERVPEIGAPFPMQMSIINE